MAEKEIKFCVFKWEDIHYCRKMYEGFEEAWNTVCATIEAERNHQGKSNDNKYIICNQDEPYADELWELILQGEAAKPNQPPSGMER